MMNEKLKIISDGIKTKVYLDGVEVNKIRKIEFNQSYDGIPVLILELGIEIDTKEWYKQMSIHKNNL